MPADHTITLNDANFENEVLKSPLPVLVDFWAAWCAPCRALAPTVDELAGEYAGRARVGKLDIDHNLSTTEKFGIKALPTIVLFKDGQIVRSFQGLHSKKELAGALDQAVDAPAHA